MDVETPINRRSALSTADDLALRLRALAHPARLKILAVLAEREQCLCGELVAGLPLAQSTVSEHLRILREAGLVRGEASGPRSCYCVDRLAIAALAVDLSQFLAAIEKPGSKRSSPERSGKAP